ncbi:WecB/TagA/CpsF family glycosyltransferase [Gorillibacterium sp. sgz5001074]|uniref:WecB/TagA/CpsF family glycosyltransferase n=1 Tax=Gorillibacterium sp. sgz5001074 TaxID=3446695 RepID=UPI003F681431
MSYETVNVLGIPFPKLTLKETVDLLTDVIDRDEDRVFHVVTVNPEIVMACGEDRELRSIVDEAGHLTADGIGIVIASGWNGNRLPERVTGFDLMISLLELGGKKGWSFYLLGADPETNEKAAATILERYPGVTIAGRQHGFFKPEEEPRIVADIEAADPDILLVALGVPKAERWIYQHKPQLKTRLAMGVGGSLDVVAGKVKRAPVFWQKIHLEWLYRLMRQPSRWRRQLVLPRFAVRAWLNRSR